MDTKNSINNDTISEAIAYIMDICENSDIILISLLMKAGKKNNTKIKVDDPNEIIKHTILSARQFIKYANTLLNK